MSQAYSMLLCPTAFTVGKHIQVSQRAGTLQAHSFTGTLGSPPHIQLYQFNSGQLQHLPPDRKNPPPSMFENKQAARPNAASSLHSRVQKLGWALWVVCITDKHGCWLKMVESALDSLNQTIHRSGCLCVGAGEMISISRQMLLYPRRRCSLSPLWELMQKWSL